MMKIGYLLLVVAILVVLAIGQNDLSTTFAVIGVLLIALKSVLVVAYSIRKRSEDKAIGTP